MKHFLIKFLLPGFIIGVLTFGILMVFGFNNLPFAVSETVPSNPTSCEQMGLNFSGGPCTPVWKLKPVGFVFDVFIFVVGGILIVLAFRKLFEKRNRRDSTDRKEV